MKGIYNYLSYYFHFETVIILYSAYSVKLYMNTLFLFCEAALLLLYLSALPSLQCCKGCLLWNAMPFKVSVYFKFPRWGVLHFLPQAKVFLARAIWYTFSITSISWYAWRYLISWRLKFQLWWHKYLNHVFLYN